MDRIMVERNYIEGEKEKEARGGGGGKKPLTNELTSTHVFQLIC